MKVKNSIKVLFAVSTVIAVTFLGCGKAVDENKGEIIPTTAPTAAPTVPPVTVTPAPTATPAPRIIGNKNSQSKFVYLTNKLDSDIRELYLMASGAEDWGDNLIPSESSIKTAEQVQMFYTPESAKESPESSSENGDSPAVVYDMKMVTAEGNTFEIYRVELNDMEKAALNFDKGTSSVYIRYMSLTEKKEKDTKGNSSETVYDNSSDYEGSSSSDSDYYNSNSDNSASDDSSDDGYYEDSSSSDGGYDDSSTDDGSSDNSSDSGNSDYDDSSTDDGSYDEGDSDNGYVDAGDGSDDYYDTTEGY